MEDQLPLILVTVATIVLWGVGKFIAKLSLKLPMTGPAKSSAHGKTFADGLHVNDMSNVLIKEAQEIITQQDEKKLTYFLARYRPIFIELDEFISSLRSKYFTNLGKPSNLASEQEKTAAINQLSLDNAPSQIDFSGLNSTELRALVEKNLKTNNLITMEFMDRFGGVNFFDNYQIYTQLVSQQNTTLHATPVHQYRKQLEAFVESGIAQQGRKIPLKDRLEVLSFEQLKEMAVDLKVNRQFHNKSEIATELSQMPGAAVHLSMIHETDDIFFIEADHSDPKSIEDEWQMLNAYSKLLIGSLRNSFVSFEEVAVN